METFTRPFIGRKRELQRLQDLNTIDRVSLVVVKGRRRIGKSRLIIEFGKSKRMLSFTGLAPVDGITAQDQRDAFAQQLGIMGLPLSSFTDWSQAFYKLSEVLTQEPTIIFFDEISWMGDHDPTFVPKLKAWWDLELQKFPKLIIIFCGSVSAWIEKNIINSTAFFGRITLQLELEPLSLPECATLLSQSGIKCSIYDTFKLLSVTGGIPWYLEQVSSHYTIDDNIKRLCFEKNGMLALEFNKIFHDLFNGKGSIYKKIVYSLIDGMKNLTAILHALDESNTHSLRPMIDDLIASGFITQHYSWSFKTEHIGKQGLYRLSDNYVRFFLKYIEPNIPKIDANSYEHITLQSLPAWDTMMGLQVENLLLNNRALLLKSLGINYADIVADNPYLQRPTSRHKGCQIDYLVQTHTKNLFVCAFKFKKRELGLEIIQAMQDKIDRFSVPRLFGVVPVLFHLSGVDDAVYEKRYFYRIIDIADFLNNSH